MKRLLPLLALTLTGCQLNVAALPEVLPTLVQVAADVAVALLEVDDATSGARVRLPSVQAAPATGPVPAAGVLTSKKEMGPVYLEHRQLPGDTWEVFLVNTHPFEVSAAFEVELDGLTAERQQPTVVLPAKGRVEVARLRRSSPGAVKWNSRIQYTFGRLDATHDDVVYLLPFGEGDERRLDQGYFGRFSHDGRHALDFSMPEGSTIRAARAGTVCDVVEKFSEGGTEERFRKAGNVVRVLHADGTIATYAHLQKDGAIVEVGEAVRAGQAIARSGNTGFSAGPHLHFEVASPADITANKMKSHATRFETASGPRPGLSFELGERFRAL